jgi:tRNA U55 pseudouridine synthase TruB
MQALTRTSIGNYRVEDAVDIDALRRNEFNLLPIMDALDLEKMEVEQIVDVKNGKALALDWCSEKILITHQNEPIAVYEYREEDGLYHCVRGLW